MKKLLSIVFVISLSSCATISEEGMRAPLHDDPLIEKSWREYCAAYNVSSVSEPSSDEYNYFLDCWSGSDEEEKAVPELYND